MNLLLDTATFLWLCAGGKELSTATIGALRQAEGTASVSAVTAWEIGLKNAKGKLELPIPPNAWFSAMIEHHRLLVWPVEASTAIASTRLPPIHLDPFDRLLIALAQERSLILVTPDATISKYPDLKTLW